MKKLKQILSNKNTVTLIAAILIVLVLYFFYNWRLDQAINPIRVPYALQTIEPRTKITDDMVGYLEISQDAIKGNIVINSDYLLNNKDGDIYSNVNSVIPQGSLFYKSQVIPEAELPDSFLVNIPEGYVPYNFSVDIASTYGNSMYPGNYVDVYFKGVNDSGMVMIGKLVENVNILAVKDSGGRHVFEASSESRTPSQIIFAVTNDVHLMLRKAEYIKDAKVILVPSTATLQMEEEEIFINVTSETLKDYINSKAITIEEDEVVE